MKTIQVPYYKGHMELHISEKNLKAVVTAGGDTFDPGKSETELVREALEHPIGTPKLRKLAKGKNRVTLITSDHTRAVPSRLTLPILLEEIRSLSCRLQEDARHQHAAEDKGGDADGSQHECPIR